MDEDQIPTEGELVAEARRTLYDLMNGTHIVDNEFLAMYRLKFDVAAYVLNSILAEPE